MLHPRKIHQFFQTLSSPNTKGVSQTFDTSEVDIGAYPMRYRFSLQIGVIEHVLNTSGVPFLISCLIRHIVSFPRRLVFVRTLHLRFETLIRFFEVAFYHLPRIQPFYVSTLCHFYLFTTVHSSTIRLPFPFLVLANS